MSLRMKAAPHKINMRVISLTMVERTMKLVKIMRKLNRIRRERILNNSLQNFILLRRNTSLKAKNLVNLMKNTLKMKLTSMIIYSQLMIKSLEDLRMIHKVVISIYQKGSFSLLTSMKIYSNIREKESNGSMIFTESKKEEYQEMIWVLVKQYRSVAFSKACLIPIK